MSQKIITFSLDTEKRKALDEICISVRSRWRSLCVARIALTYSTKRSTLTGLLKFPSLPSLALDRLYFPLG
ncbi:hypothetical protein ACE1CD_16160 [Aerosakkonema sp. BLCC-F183]|uniref:hypothetical protein n=1 Tax=Aerosakkonema sp. BLCC-F183 TaxID=3342834 RepID=UPI0035B8CF66